MLLLPHASGYPADARPARSEIAKTGTSAARDETHAWDELRKPESDLGWPLLSTKSGSRLRS